MTNEEINKLVIEHHGKLNSRELAELCGVSEQSIRNRRARMGLVKLPKHGRLLDPNGSVYQADRPKQAHRPWLPKEELYVIETYTTTTAVQQADSLGRNLRAVRNKRVQLLRRGLVTVEERFYGRIWSRQEDQAIREMAGKIPAPALAKHLGRTRSALYDRANLLGVSIQWDGESTTSMARALGYRHTKTVRNWEKWGWLTPIRPGKHGTIGYISREQVLDFIRRYGFVLDWRAIQPGPYRQLAELLYRRDPWVLPHQAAAMLGLHVDRFSRAARETDVEYRVIPDRKNPTRLYRLSGLRTIQLQAEIRAQRARQAARERVQKINLGRRKAA